ncbi:MAG TPA: preprotein translocase subunit SecE [Gemmataceae bacterium]|nr:preprotein translocase subunit SecE [Gemmataceae bacterium]
MAVAVKNTPEATSQRVANAFALGSLAGTAYVLGSIAIVFYGIPSLWNLAVGSVFPGAVGRFEDRALLLLVILGAAVGLVALGKRVLGPTPTHGIRAGTFLGTLGTFLLFLITVGIGQALASGLGADKSAIGPWITLAIGIALLAGWAYLFFWPAFERKVSAIEDQGWLSGVAYKRSQGQRVRRGTVLGILILAGCGVYAMITRDTLRSAASQDWTVTIPFTGEQSVSAAGKAIIIGAKTITFLPHLQFTLPILVAAASLWIAYRIVNFPPFADFLIATEAELNKVSWTTRKRLVQDTIVVLATMLLMTTFLFVVDILWVKLMSSSWVQVLQTGTSTMEKQDTEQDW